MGEFTKISRRPQSRRKPGRMNEVAFLLVELQEFETIAEAYGDDVGFAALSILADLLRHNIRNDDLLIHKGNGDFVIMLAGVDEIHADEIVLRRLQRLLDSDLILTIGRERIRLHGQVGPFSALDAATPFENAAEISVFM